MCLMVGKTSGVPHPGQLPAAEDASPLQPAPGKDHLRQGQLRIHAA